MVTVQNWIDKLNSMRGLLFVRKAIHGEYSPEDNNGIAVVILTYVITLYDYCDEFQIKLTVKNYGEDTEGAYMNREELSKLVQKVRKW